MRAPVLLMCLYFINNYNLRAQESTREQLDALYNDLDSLLNIEEIPLDLLALADSLMKADLQAKKSRLSVRMSYISQISSAGRTLGVEQYGFSPGISYYHKSGFLGNISGYWNSQSDPSYTMTIATLGYSNYFLKKVGYFISHDFYFYHDSLSYHSFNKSASVSVFTGFKYIDLDLDYTFLYGEKNAYRIYANINGIFQWKKIGWIDKISIMPTAGITLGNSDIINVRLEEGVQKGDFMEFLSILQSENYPTLSQVDYRRLFLLAKEKRFRAMYLLLLNNGYSQEQINEITTEVRTIEEVENSFGLMNISFSAPVSIKKGKLNWLINYTYNIPIELPGEDGNSPKNGFVSLSLSYNL